MSDPRLPILDELGDALDTAFRAHERAERDERAAVTARPPLRRRLRALLVAPVLALLLGASAAAGTLVVLRGSPVPAPAARDGGPAQTPAPGTTRLADASAADPADGPGWALRVARSRTGLVCATVGQVLDGDFGLVGLDGRFRPFAERIVDGCSAPRPGDVTLLGARVFDAERAQDVRTVVSGVAGGAALREVVVDAAGRRTPVPVADDGTFLAALRGYPEDLAVRVTLRFAGGRERTQPFGVSAFVVPDPAGGRAWRAEAFGFGVRPGAAPNPRSCVAFRPAREAPSPATSPAACGILRGGRRRTGVFFAVRRITPGTGGVPVDLDGEGDWGEHPARTAVWGQAGDDVEQVEVEGPGVPRRDVPVAPSRAFLAVLPPAVHPAGLTVTVRSRGGRVARYRGSTNLVDGGRP